MKLGKRGTGRILNALWWLTAGSLFLWGRALEWSLEPPAAELIVSVLVWLLCSVFVSEILLQVGRRIRLLERPIPEQFILGSGGHFVGTIFMLFVLSSVSKFEPFTLDCGGTVDQVESDLQACVDKADSTCWQMKLCERYNRQRQAGDSGWVVVFLLTLWIPTAASVAHLFRAQRIESEVQRTRTALAEARLQSVRHQVSSHLVFNALNSILHAVEDGSKNSVRMIMDLSYLLRRSLDEETGEYSFGNELERVRLYLRIEKYRFEEELQVKFDIDDRIQTQQCLPVTIQPLVENAIKHGFRGGALPLHVDISAKIEGDMVKVLVVNNGRLHHQTKKTSQEHRIGLGLDLLSTRLASEYGEMYRLSVDEIMVDGESVVRAEVAWPLMELGERHG